jgi:hypothetical protein
VCVGYVWGVWGVCVGGVRIGVCGVCQLRVWVCVIYVCVGCVTSVCGGYYVHVLLLCVCVCVTTVCVGYVHICVYVCVSHLCVCLRVSTSVCECVSVCRVCTYTVSTVDQALGTEKSSPRCIDS